MPLPNGIFSPMISFGAVFGRMYGRALLKIGEYFGIRLIKSKPFI
jgi:H+/Cl- antiporter ClcA